MVHSGEGLTVELVSAKGKRMVTSGVNELKLQASGKADLSRKGIVFVLEHQVPLMIMDLILYRKNYYKPLKQD
ncbi:hypothetical protein [Siminovitchia sp. 179-K 8D1 HS]|uniref:hypothetical protein n=1 Tax=Siminovitchia sp. 179-K 8D1 HS TaxID=3142385 RepID=UPI0039A01237